MYDKSRLTFIFSAKIHCLHHRTLVFAPICEQALQRIGLRIPFLEAVGTTQHLSEKQRF